MLVDSKKHKLNPLQIIIAAHHQNPRRTLKQFVGMVEIEMKMPQVFKCQEGNTIFLIHRTAVPGVGYLKTVNADTPRNFIKSCQKIAELVYHAGFDKLIAQTDQKSIVNIFKRIVDHPVRPHMKLILQKTNIGSHQCVLQLGHSRTKGKQ